MLHYNYSLIYIVFKHLKFYSKIKSLILQIQNNIVGIYLFI